MAFLIVITLLMLATALAAASPRRALAIVVFFSPWAGLDVDIGLGVTAYLVFLAPLAIVVVFKALFTGTGQRILASLGVFWFVVAYAVLWSLIQIPFLPEAGVQGGLLRTPEFRAVAQIVMFLITISPIIVVPLVIRRLEDIKKLAKIYISSALVLAVIGWLQLAIWIATGSDPFPVGLTDQLLGGAASTRSGQFMFEGELIYRMSSFGGEPKGLGVALAVALLLLQAGIRSERPFGKVLWPFLFVSMIATFSTMAMLTWLGASLVQYATSRDLRFRLPRISTRIARASIASTLTLLIMMATTFVIAPESRIVQLIESRTVDRVSESESGFLEDFNVAVLGYLRSQPAAVLTGVGLGNIHLYADPFLPHDAVRYAGGTAFVAKSYLLRWISEIGIVSFLMFLVWLIGRFRYSVALVGNKPTIRSWAPVIAKFSMSLLAFWLVSGYITPQFFLTVGIVIALGLIIRRQYHHAPLFQRYGRAIS